MLHKHFVHSELTVGDLPFPAKRFFIVEDNGIRGNHAHYHCEQYIVLIKGDCLINLEHNREKKKIYLNDYTLGLYIPKMTWVEYKLDGMIIVFASDEYDENDYIRDYSTFINETY